MKLYGITLGLLALLAGQAEHVNAVSLALLTDENKLDDNTKQQVKRAAAAALKVAVAAKKAEAAEDIKGDMKEVQKAETREQSDAITEALDRSSKDEEKKAVEKAVAHVERIRQQKLVAHQNALKEIQNIKAEA